MKSRELHLLLQEVGTEITVWKFASELVNALKCKSITSKQYSMFVEEMTSHCEENNISTESPFLTK